MKNLRSTFRLRFIMLLLLCVALTLGSFWMVEVMHKKTEEVIPTPARTEPDYYVDNFNYVQMAIDGQPRYNITGQRLTHNPMDDSFDVILPVIHSLSKDNPPMTLRSDTGKIEDNNSKVNLYGNVKADRLPTPTSSEFHLKSEYLLLLPDDDIIKSDKFVEMTLDQSVMTGTGLYANNATRVMKLFKNVHANIPPSTKKP
ncbi:LPS export ABC transporter periplasmic protein LptC [Glaciimonas soli]|uniref:LPS export ABC transporter periplasmic protein LptC n=1 Tax=Glaciimonas soli TaxID=2590999 RepID=A0A843YZL9_9BURK|nr:LPS export ABC transporter periplasmic protein LptC [Glaciimonas soli]MQR02672.1 LPS export ABC transporter periplasmic protein LptC [Glaciimonas soli]